MTKHLVWARLYAAGKKGATEAATKKDLQPTLARVLGPEAARDALTQLIDDQIAEGNLQAETSGRSVKYRLSDEGWARARQLLPHSEGKTWSAIAKTELAAHALGIHDSLNATQIALLSRATTLQFCLLREYFELDVPQLPSATEVEQALVWQAMRRGLVDSVFDWAKNRKLGLPLVVSALAASWGEVRPSVKKGEVFTRIAAKAAGAKSSKDLHAALLTRLVERPPEATDAPELSSNTERDPGEANQAFAAQVLDSARRSQSGKLDSSLILINHAHAQYAKEHPGDAGSLDEFKEQLWSAAIGGFLTLASADMPQVLDAEDYSKSRINRGSSIFSLIRI